MQDERIPLTEPENRAELEPFAAAFLEIVAPEAVKGRWFEAMQTPPESELARISRRVEASIGERFGHPVHAAIYVHALLVCGSFFYEAAEAVEDPAQRERQTAAVDAAFSLTQSLMLYHNLHDLYVRLS